MVGGEGWLVEEYSVVLHSHRLMKRLLRLLRIAVVNTI
jgi:hypothetical protein